MKPFTDKELQDADQFIDSARRLGKMFQGVVLLGEHIASITSIKRAANEANASLEEFRSQLEAARAERDTLRLECDKLKGDLEEAYKGKQAELASLDTQISAKHAELEEVIKKRAAFLESLGVRA